MQFALWPGQELISRLNTFGWLLAYDPIETNGYRAQWLLSGNGDDAYFSSLAGLEDWLSHQERAAQK